MLCCGISLSLICCCCCFCCFCRFVMCMCYYGISLALNGLKGSIYVTFCISAAAEV